MKIKNQVQKELALNKGMLKLVGSKKVSISPSLFQLLNDKIFGIKNWSLWCAENGIHYDTFLNLKYGRVRYINTTNIYIFEALNIDLNGFYKC